MAKKDFIEQKTVSVPDNDGTTYKIELEAYFEDDLLNINVFDKKAKLRLLSMMLYKNSETGWYQNNPRSGWMFELPAHWPRRMGLGRRIWTEIESLLRICCVSRVYGVVGEPPVFAEHCGWVDPRREGRIRGLEEFWSKMGFTITADHCIQKDYALPD